MMALGLRRLAALYKDPYFKDERETRVMIELESHINDKYELGERVNAYGENASYHELLTSFDNLSDIKEVMIGPNCRYTQADVEALLPAVSPHRLLIRVQQISPGRRKLADV